MARRARTAAPAEPVAAEPQTEETAEETAAGGKRGPGLLAQAHYDWIVETYGDVVGVELLYLAQTTRREFRATDAYGAVLDEIDKAKEAAAQEKADRAAAREAAKAAAEAEQPAEGDAPATTTRRGRKAAQPAANEEAPAEPAKPARRARAAKAAPAAETPATDAAPASRRRVKAPF